MEIVQHPAAGHREAALTKRAAAARSHGAVRLSATPTPISDPKPLRSPGPRHRAAVPGAATRGPRVSRGRSAVTPGGGGAAPRAPLAAAPLTRRPPPPSPARPRRRSEDGGVRRCGVRSGAAQQVSGARRGAGSGRSRGAAGPGAGSGSGGRGAGGARAVRRAARLRPRRASFSLRFPPPRPGRPGRRSSLRALRELRGSVSAVLTLSSARPALQPRGPERHSRAVRGDAVRCALPAARTHRAVLCGSFSTEPAALRRPRRPSVRGRRAVCLSAGRCPEALRGGSGLFRAGMNRPAMGQRPRGALCVRRFVFVDNLKLKAG